MYSFLQKIIILFFILSAQFAKAQVKFWAATSDAIIGKNQMVQIKFTIENAKDVQQITAPNFKNFSVVSGPNKESGMSIVNGEVKQYISVIYVLKPNRVGHLSIAPATALIDNKQWKSNAVEIKVNNSLSANNANSNNLSSAFSGLNLFEEATAPTVFNDNILHKGESATEKINKNIFLKLQLDKTTCFVGEPITATYKLYTRLKTESSLVKNPSFNGFSVIDLQQPENESSQTEKVNGKEYNVYIIRKAQLYPLQAGQHELESVKMENNVYFIKQEYADKQTGAGGDIFNQFDESTLPAGAIENSKVTLQSQPVVVNVKALPNKNVPPNFRGAVGNFKINAQLDKNNFTTNDVIKLKIIISGQGNLQLVNNPVIQWPQGFEAFEPSAADDFIKTTVPVSGKKNIDYPFIITEAGTYHLPSLYFSYFNPEQAKYITDSTQPITLVVSKGAVKETLVGEQKNVSTNNFFNKFFGNRIFVVCTVAVLILGGLMFWLKKDRQKEGALKKNRVAAEEKNTEEKTDAAKIDFEEKNYLQNARDLLNEDSPLFYIELNCALKNYLSTKLNLPPATINKQNIFDALDKQNVPVLVVQQLQQTLTDIELQLYTPFALTQKRNDLYHSVIDIIAQMEAHKI